jgi:hypothetical protein
MAVAKKKQPEVVSEAPKGRQVKCRCGRVCVLVERDRLTIYDGEEEPWTSFGEEPGEGRVEVACDGCAWSAVFTKGAEGYVSRIQQGKRAAARVREEWLEE